MWPQTLQMSDDDCRSTLRRLELETYASVVGVFRAQGGLSDKKVKLLDELRNIFHISQDRHRAEARRVANDEYLSTIAKVVSGPNTWQEWSREGRRAYPMLPRVAPQTALGWIANNLAAEAALENAKLPYPAETAVAAFEEQKAIKATTEAAEISNLRCQEKYVVTSDPFKLPNIPTVGAKKNLKRGMNDGQQTTHSSLGKKRNVNDAGSPHKQKHITATSSSVPPASGGNRRTINNAVLQQQRFFYQQQQKAKKLAKAASKREKLPGTGKLGRKPKKLKEQEQRQQREREQQEQFLQQQQHQQDFGDRTYEHQLMQRVDHADFALSTNIANVMIDMGNQGQSSQHPQSIDIESNYAAGNQKSHYVPMAVPQIAASKRDITRNLTKLQIPSQASTSPTAHISKYNDTAHSSQLTPVQKASTVLTGNKATSDGKLAQLSTPVQKYIVEDRQPQITTASAGALPPSLMGQQTTSQFIAGLPQAKLRSINTTILPAGTKLSIPVKKVSGLTVLSPSSSGGGVSSPILDNIVGGNAHTSSQLYSIVDGIGSNQANISQQQQQQHLLSQPITPTHTPPAVIQLHNNEVLRVGSAHPSPGGSSTSSAQSKVLTTKILPIVLSSNSAKAETAKNGGASIVSVSAANFITNSPGATIIKSMPASLLVSGQHGTNASNSASSVFSSFGSSSGPIYRKHPNILRSSSSTVTRQLQNSTPKTGGPQIISNIRLTPAITPTTGPNSSFGGTPTQSSIFQQQIRSTPSTSTGIRTSVKICQSPNGKVFIQPANMAKLPSGHITQRLLPSTILSGSNSNLTGSSIGTLTNKPGSPRIAIQKVQIIPAPLSGNNFSTAANASQQHTQQRLAATTLTLGGANSGGKSGSNLFIQARSTTAVGNAMTLGSKSSPSISSSSDNLSSIGKNSSVVVIDAGGKSLPSQNTTKITASNLKRVNIDSSQMITEDTPVDIIVDDSPTEATTVVNSTPADESSSITAVLASNLVTQAQHVDQAQTEQHHQKQSTISLPMTVLNATDWEMELDQAKAASSTVHQQHIGGDSSKQQQPNQSEQLETAETIIIDDSFEDVIIEEEEQDDTTATESEHYDSEDQQQPQFISHQNDNDNIKMQQCLTTLNDYPTSKTVDQMAETNYESVPMCIEDSIETTHIDGGSRAARLSESDVDASFTSSGNDNVSSNTDIVQSRNNDCNESDDASQKSLITMEHQFSEQEKRDDQTEESSQDYNNIEENAQIISSSPTPKIEVISKTSNKDKVEENDIMAIEEVSKTFAETTTTEIETTTSSTTTKVSASLLTVKDYDTAESESTLKANNESPKTNFDFTDEAKSNQSDVALNTPTAEQ